MPMPRAAAALLLASLACASRAAASPHAAAAPALGASALAGPAADGKILERTLRVNGEGRVMVRPDVAIVLAGVEATGKTLAPTVADASAKMRRMLDALAKAGVAEKDVQTTRHDVQVERPWVDGKPREITGYTVVDEVRVTVRESREARSDPRARGRRGLELAPRPHLRARQSGPRAPAGPRARRRGRAWQGGGDGEGGGRRARGGGRHRRERGGTANPAHEVPSRGHGGDGRRAGHAWRARRSPRACP